MPFFGDHAPPIVLEPHTTWYHGSPLRLEILQTGSTVTPAIELAKAFSHKPSRLEVRIEESDEDREVIIEHNGQAYGYLYRVLVDDPAQDLKQHPGSGFAPGEEVLTTRDLPLEFLYELPIPNFGNK